MGQNGRPEAPSILSGIEAPLKCGHCKSVAFSPRIRVEDGRPRVVRLECQCGLVYGVDGAGIIETSGRGGLSMNRINPARNRALTG